MKRISILMIFYLALSVMVQVQAKGDLNKIGLGVSISNASHLEYPSEILNQINYKLVYYPIPRIRIEPILRYRDYKVQIGRLTLEADDTQKDNHWNIQSYGLGVSYLVFMNSFDIGIGGMFRKDIVDSEEILSLSYQGEVQSAVGLYDKYDINSYFVKLELVKTIKDKFRVRVESGYRFSDQFHETRAYGEIKEQTQGIHYGASIEFLLF